MQIHAIQIVLLLKYSQMHNIIITHRKYNMQNRYYFLLLWRFSTFMVTLHLQKSKSDNDINSLVNKMCTALIAQMHWLTSYLVTHNLPWKSSGAAYGGLPQNVSSFDSLLNSLLKPKSTILMFISLSSRRFSACVIIRQRLALTH